MKKLLVLAALFAVFAAFGAAQPQIDAQLMKTDPTPLQTSEYADVWIEIENNGSEPAENVTLEFDPEYPFTVDPDEQTTWQFREIDEADEYQVHMQVRVDENAVHGTERLKFWTQSNEQARRTQYFPVEVRTDDAALVIDDVVFPDAVAPGSRTQMTVTLQNLADSTLKNIDTTLGVNGENLPFATVGTTRQRIQSLAPNETTNATYTVVVDESADNGVYKTPISLSYEDESGTGFTVNDTTGVVVGGAANLEVGVEETETLRQGTTNTVTLRIVNTGEGTARFVGLTIPDGESHEVVSTDSIYIGNMQSDDYQTAEFEVYVPENTETLFLPVNMTYKGADGDQSAVKTVRTPVYDQEALQRLGLSNGTNPLIYLVMLLVIAGVGGWYWRKRKRRKQA